MLTRPRPSIDFEAMFGASPNPYVLLAPDLTIVTMNDAYRAVTMREFDDLVGKPMFEAFPSDPASDSYQLLRNSLDRVLRTAERDEIALIRYDIPLPSGAYEERYWSATHTPLLDEAGEVAFILQHTVDVTELQRLRRFAAQAAHSFAREEAGVFERASAVQEANQNLVQETGRLRALFEQAPGFVAVLSGSELRFQTANAAYRKLVGHRDIIGKTVAEALPEVVEQGFPDLLERVRTSGQPFIGRSVGVHLESELHGSLEERFLDFIYQPIHGGNDGASGVFVQGHDVTEQRRAENALRESEERFRLVADSAPVMLWMGDRAGKCLYLNNAQREFWGVAMEDLQGFDWVATIHPEDRPRIGETVLASMARREPFTVEGRYGRADGEICLLQTTARPRFSSSGDFLGMIGVNLDLTEARRAQDHQQLLINELNHRVKNTLSIVQALAMQSFNDRVDPAVARGTFDARLNALSAAHNLLTTQNWESAGLLEIIHASVAATAGANVDRVTLQGPDILIAPQTAVSLAMAIHELCTNAIKYGALSNEEGRVDVRWTATSDDAGLIELAIDWTEADGPPVEVPSRRGFGTRLIERGLSAELRSSVTLDFCPSGLKCTILARLPAESK